jgi:hypothetical protein
LGLANASAMKSGRARTGLSAFPGQAGWKYGLAITRSQMNISRSEEILP